MIRFAFGYQPAAAESTAEIVRDYRQHIAEVYFSWPGTPSARALSSRRRGTTDRAARQIMVEELCAIRKMKVKLDLLFNANCYGGRAISRGLEKSVSSIIGRLSEKTGGIDIVTTASPMVARTVKKYYPKIEVRASVNMRIGTIPALSYSRELFDSYYIQRDIQRNLSQVRRLKKWADRNGKGLCMLANSGCLRFCPAQTFHDNLVAHDEELSGTLNVSDWNPHLCWSLYRDRRNWPAILQGSWIRPEDLYHYDGIFRVVKLATRMHEHPRMVIHAYARARHNGNLLDLFEPGFGPAFAPYVLDNTRFPPGFHKWISSCKCECDECRYCAGALEKALVRYA
jgi:collagenase-like PrtC family protease